MFLQEVCGRLKTISSTPSTQYTVLFASTLRLNNGGKGKNNKKLNQQIYNKKLTDVSPIFCLQGLEIPTSVWSNLCFIQCFTTK